MCELKKRSFIFSEVGNPRTRNDKYVISIINILMACCRWYLSRSGALLWVVANSNWV